MSFKRLQIILLVFLVACASESDRINRDLSSLEGRLRDIRNLDAEQTSELAEVQQSLRELSGRLEALERNQIAAPTNNQLYNQQIPNKNVNVTVVPNLELLADQRVAVQRKINGDESFYQGLIATGDGRFSQAIGYFNQTDLTRSNTPVDLAGYLMFWKGVAFQGERKPYEALREYGELVNQYPKHKRVPLGLLKQAEILLELKDQQTAKVVLQKLSSDYPGTKEAFEAKQLLVKSR